MRIKYFTDTDTALIEFADRPIQETTEINENIYLDLIINNKFIEERDPSVLDGIESFFDFVKKLTDRLS